jgi:Cu-Zn family superoxide dismutase
MSSIRAVAVFNTRSVKGEVVFSDKKDSVTVEATFSKLPTGEHGFHIHKAGDLRGEGCKLACAHFHKGEGAGTHGGPPGTRGPRHTGDLGNISEPRTYTYTLKGLQCEELWGRCLIVHEDEDDFGLGGKEDSLVTGHAGRRIACAVIGRTMGAC